MARRKSGAFSKVLEIIGLVDDEDPRDSYEDGYAGDGYGRQSTYIPQQQRTRGNDTIRRTQDRTSASQRDVRSARYDSQARYSDAPVKRRTSTLIERVDGERDSYRSSAYRDRSDRYDQDSYAARSNPASMPRSARYSGEEAPRTSRFAESSSSSRFSQETAVPAVRESRPVQRQRTVMFSLHSLEDCCDVIDNLISNNTVVLTLDDLDVKLMQRAVDTLSGAVFALHATIRKASDRTYLIAPSSVEVNESYDVERRY